MKPLLKRLNLNVFFENALFVSKNLVKMDNKYSDELIVNIKMLDEKTLNVLCGNVNQFLSNLNFIDLSKTTFRIPVTKYRLVNTKEICDLIKQYQPRKVEIFKLQSGKKEI